MRLILSLVIPLAAVIWVGCVLGMRILMWMTRERKR